MAEPSTISTPVQKFMETLDRDDVSNLTLAAASDLMGSHWMIFADSAIDPRPVVADLAVELMSNSEGAALSGTMQAKALQLLEMAFSAIAFGLLVEGTTNALLAEMLSSQPEIASSLSTCLNDAAESLERR